MSVLVEDFFQRDLRLTEKQNLEQELGSTEESARQMVELARQAYEATGLPEPRWKKRKPFRIPLPSKETQRGLLGIFLFGVSCLAGLWWAYENRVALKQRLLEKLHQSPIDPVWQKHQVLQSGPGFDVKRPARQGFDTAAPKPLIQDSVEASQASPARTIKEYPVVAVQQSSAGRIEIAVFNQAGQRLKTLYRGEIDAGSYDFDWDGKDEKGFLMKPGVYEVRIFQDDGVVIDRMVLE